VELLLSGLVTGLFLGGLYALSAFGLSLVYGVMGLVNLAHGDFMILAAFLSFSLTGVLHLDPLVSLVLVSPCMFVLGYAIQGTLINRLLSKRSLEAGIVTTLGLSLILQTVLQDVYTSQVRTFTPGYAARGTTFFGITVPNSYLLCFGVALAVAAGTHMLVRRTSFGRQARAAAEDPVTARLMGIRVERTYNLTFGLGAALSAVAGVLIGVAFSFTPFTGTTFLLKGFAVVVLGGLGSIVGTLVAGLALGAVEGLGASIFGGSYRDLVTYAVFLLILLLAPNGLFGGRSQV